MSAFDPEQLTDAPVVDRDEQELGMVADVYVDQLTGRPGWLLVETGRFGEVETFVPLARAIPHNDGIQVPYSKDQVNDAPKVDPDGQLSPEEEDRLYEHYEPAFAPGHSERIGERAQELKSKAQSETDSAGDAGSRSQTRGGGR